RHFPPPTDARWCPHNTRHTKRGKGKRRAGIRPFPDCLTRRSSHTSQGCPLRYAVTCRGIGFGDQPGVFPRPPITEVSPVQTNGPTTDLRSEERRVGKEWSTLV